MNSRQEYYTRRVFREVEDAGVRGHYDFSGAAPAPAAIGAKLPSGKPRSA